MNLPVIEVFKSIQGEGICVGTPSVFIRTGGCNLNCDFCDTSYSWKDKTEMNIDGVLEFVELAVEQGYSHIVVTGGEPTLHWEKMEILLERIGREIADDPWELYTTVETNGSLYQAMYSAGVDLVSISPKMDKINDAYLNSLRSYVDEPLGYFSMRDMQFKFLVQYKQIDEDLEKIHKLMENIRMERIIDHVILILQPMWHKDDDYLKVTQQIADYIQTPEIIHRFSGFHLRVIPQLHKFLWGNQRYK